MAHKKSEIANFKMAHKKSEIANFYKDRSIFITGATGFLGKLLVEKLLRSCSELRNIYILVRTKRGQNADVRLQELLKSRLFDKVVEKDPSLLHKVVAIAGDIMFEDLGISQQDAQTLRENVSVIFHSAATVKFDEPLKLAVTMNLLGTQKMIQLGKTMPLLESFVHVSTAYSNCNRTEIEEIIYPTNMQPEKMINFVQSMDEEVIDHVTPKLLGDHPNTYTYTKSLAEQLVASEFGTMPVAIVRPAIMHSTWREPFPGWADNMNGTIGIGAGIGKGVIRVVRGETTANVDLMPADITINLAVSVGWYTATHKSKEIQIFNNTSSNMKPTTWGSISKVCVDTYRETPLNDIFMYPAVVVAKSQLLFNLLFFITQILPAFISDIFMKLTGNKPRMMRLQDNISRAIKTMKFFPLHVWKFDSKNVKNLAVALKGNDGEIFNFDLSTIIWDNYIENSCLGLKTYFFKDDPNTLKSAKLRSNRLMVLHYLLLGVCMSVVAISFIAIVSAVISLTSHLRAASLTLPSDVLPFNILRWLNRT